MSVGILPPPTLQLFSKTFFHRGNIDMKLARTESEINDVLNRAAAWEERGGSAVPGQSFEVGVGAGIRWLIGDTDENPIEVEPEEE